MLDKLERNVYTLCSSIGKGNLMEQEQAEAVVIDDPKIIRYTDKDAKEWRIWLDGVEIFDATEVNKAAGIVWRKTYTRQSKRTGGERREANGTKAYQYFGEVRAERASNGN